MCAHTFILVRWDFKGWLERILPASEFQGAAPGKAYEWAFGESTTCFQVRAGEKPGDVLLQYKLTYGCKEEEKWLPGETQYRQEAQNGVEPPPLSFPDGFLFTWPTGFKGSVPKIAGLAPWKHRDLVEDEFLRAFAERGFGKGQADATGVDYGDIWRAFFAQCPSSRQELLEQLRPHPKFSIPVLGLRGNDACMTEEEHKALKEVLYNVILYH